MHSALFGNAEALRTQSCCPHISYANSAFHSFPCRTWPRAHARSQRLRRRGGRQRRPLRRKPRQRWEQQQLATYESQYKKPPKNWQSKYKEPAAPDTANLPELPDGWCWATVPQVAESCLGKMLDKNKHVDGDKLPYLRNVNVRWRSVDTTDLREMFFKPGDEDRFGLKQGDVLVCEGGEPGRAAVWHGQVENMRFQKAIHRVRCGTGLLPEYLVFVLESFAKSGLLERLFTGSTIKHFTGVSFAKMPLPFPPIQEQRRIVELADATVEGIMRCNDEITVNLERSDRLRQSILKNSFEGKLVEAREAALA